MVESRDLLIAHLYLTSITDSEFFFATMLWWQNYEYNNDDDDDDDDDVLWFNVRLKLTRGQLSLAHSIKVKTDMPRKNDGRWN